MVGRLHRPVGSLEEMPEARDDDLVLRGRCCRVGHAHAPHEIGSAPDRSGRLALPPPCGEGSGAGVEQRSVATCISPHP